MEVNCVWEHNGEDTLLYCVEQVGAYARGESLEKAAEKLLAELAAYAAWRGETAPESVRLRIVQEKCSELCIADADSDVIFDGERLPLTPAEYRQLKELALRSARNFQTLYDSVPDKDVSVLPQRTTFYGAAPRTAREMYMHTKNVNAYYFAEIGVAADNEGDIAECRARGFALLERQPDFLTRPALEGSYGELWSLRKVLRRFIWHDRIHARAMCRMTRKTFGPGAVSDPFHFDKQQTGCR